VNSRQWEILARGAKALWLGQREGWEKISKGRGSDRCANSNRNMNKRLKKELQSKGKKGGKIDVGEKGTGVSTAEPGKKMTKRLDGTREKSKEGCEEKGNTRNCGRAEASGEFRLG